MRPLIDGETADSGALDILNSALKSVSTQEKHSQTPVEREYGYLYGESPVSEADLTDETSIVKGLYSVISQMHRSERTGIHPVETHTQKVFEKLDLSKETKEIISEELDCFDSSFCWNLDSEEGRLYTTYFHLQR